MWFYSLENFQAFHSLETTSVVRSGKLQQISLQLECVPDITFRHSLPPVQRPDYLLSAQRHLVLVPLLMKQQKGPLQSLSLIKQKFLPKRFSEWKKWLHHLKLQAKKKLPFSTNNLPKKHCPVDVEKAFGKDRSFLPRPPAPPDPEDAVSTKETEKALAELEAMSNVASDSQLVKNANTTATSLLGDMIFSDPEFLPISDLESEAQKLDAASASHIETVPTTASSTETMEIKIIQRKQKTKKNTLRESN
ncbi:hypothetical protein AVEN_224909-1 [Araneus ventricosus]|uniref:Uncharacterized protein n=1 Tax=Araneus ventricosus TaxID=182803 RepID=A0A4Y2Q0Y0_ARAVE|nr:hypothetical protein AVEN_224909-1 [Araneus ventricosus]